MIDIDFRFYLSVFWRRLPLFLLVWILIASIGIAIAYLLPSVYKAEARFLVESQQIDKELQGTTVTSPAEEIIQRIRARILTRTNLLDVEQRFGALGRWEGYSPTERVEIMKNSIEFDVLDLAEGGRGPAATAFSIGFYSESAQITVDVTNDLVTQILEMGQGVRIDDANKNYELFKRQLDELSKELADQEEQIINFKIENSGQLPESLEFRRTEMSRIQTRLQQIESQMLTLREQRSSFQRVLDNPELQTSILPQTRRSPEQAELAQLKRRRLERTRVLSDNHPEIIALDNQIAALEEYIGSLIIDDQGNPSGGVLNETRVALQTVDVELRFLDGQRKDMESELSRLAKTIEQTPNVESQLNVLNRRLQQLELQYDDTLVKFNIAKGAREVEETGLGERFDVIEQASYPDEPIRPNRLLIALGAIIGGLGLAGGLVVLLELMNNSIRRPVELVNRLGIQPFAVVPYIPTRAEILRQRVKAVLSVIGVAVFVPALLYLVHYYYMPIDLILSNMAERFGIDGLALMFS